MSQVTIAQQSRPEKPTATKQACSGEAHYQMGKRKAAEISASSMHLLPGGYKQKLKWSAESDKIAKPKERLASLLLNKWSWGMMSAAFVQEIAHAALHDGASGDDLRGLAGLGCAGLYPNNCHRELVNKLQPPILRSALLFTEIQFKKTFRL